MSIFGICFILYFLKLSACRGFMNKWFRGKGFGLQVSSLAVQNSALEAFNTKILVKVNYLHRVHKHERMV